MTSKQNNNTELMNAMQTLIQKYKKGSYRYIEEFFRLDKSASDMLLLGIFPNAKEVTESYAAFNAVRKNIELDTKDTNVVVISVWDGRTPRTAALFAFLTKWQSISVDPQLNTEKIPFWESKIQRLKCIPKKIEDIDLKFKKVIIVAVHSHAPLLEILNHVKAEEQRSLISIPCCISYNYNKTSCKEYYDAGIWSEKNLVKIWKTI